MPPVVRTESASPRALAAVRAQTTRQQLGTDIVRLLDLVWPVLREQGVSTGHNVVVYGDWEEDPAKRRTDVFFLLR